MCVCERERERKREEHFLRIQLFLYASTDHLKSHKQFTTQNLSAQETMRNENYANGTSTTVLTSKFSVYT